MGKKGLSRDEKLAKIQELLHESKTAYTLKVCPKALNFLWFSKGRKNKKIQELETRAYKEKGIVANTVKDIAQVCVFGSCSVGWKHDFDGWETK